MYNKELKKLVKNQIADLAVVFYEDNFASSWEKNLYEQELKLSYNLLKNIEKEELLKNDKLTW